MPERTKCTGHRGLLLRSPQENPAKGELADSPQLLHLWIDHTLPGSLSEIWPIVLQKHT